MFPEDGSVPHLRSALFVLGSGGGDQHSARDAQASPAAPAFSFAAAEARCLVLICMYLTPDTKPAP